MATKPSKHDHDRSEVWERPDLVAEVEATMTALGRNLRALRLRKKLSQEQVAERAGLHAKHVQRLEAGAKNTTIASVTAVACALGVRVEALLRAPRSK